jgi:hypothetical protein
MRPSLRTVIIVPPTLEQIEHNRLVEAARGPTAIRRFQLVRREDLSQNSGTGVVAIGALYPSGRCYLEFLPGDLDLALNECSFTSHTSLRTLELIHGHLDEQGDPRTTIRWIDEFDAELQPATPPTSHQEAAP